MSVGSLSAVLDTLGAAVAQSGSTSERVMVALAQILGLSLVAAGVAAVVALFYRWYVRERVPGGLPALIGLSAIVPFFGVNQLLRNLIEPVVGQAVVDEATAVFNIAAFLVALGATRVGTDAGDRLGQDFFASTGDRAIESEVGRVVQAVGRVLTVELPDEIEDIVGYDPVPDATKESLAGTTFVFPRRLTVEQLHDRLVTRLKADYAVGHVDLELAADGTVEHLSVGSRAAGIGPTLPPETSAVAVRADPAFAAGAGDLVQIWRTDPFQRVLTAEVRGTVDDVVTLAIDAADTRKLDAETRYKLVTLPVEARPDREFASVLRSADETMAAITVANGSALAGQPVGALDVSIVAIRPTEGAVEPLPARDRLLGPGDALYLVATPEAIRKVELGASAGDGRAGSTDAAPSAGSGAHLGPDEQVDATTPVAGASDEQSETGTTPTAPDQSEGASSGATTAESPEAPEPSGPSIDDFAAAPGIETLEPEESEAEAETTQAELSEAETPGIDALEPDEDADASGEPTRSDLEPLPGTDVNGLTGVEQSSGGPEESDGDSDSTEEETQDSGDADARDFTDEADANGEEADGEDSREGGDADEDDICVSASDAGDDPLAPSADDSTAEVDSDDEADAAGDDEDAAAGDDNAADEAPAESTDRSDWSVAVDERRDSNEDENEHE